MTKFTKEPESRKSAINQLLKDYPDYNHLLQIDIEKLNEYKVYHSAIIDFNFCINVLDQLSVIDPSIPFNGDNLNKNEHLKERIMIQCLNYSFMLIYSRCFFEKHKEGNFEKNNGTKLIKAEEILKKRKHQFNNSEFHNNWTIDKWIKLHKSNIEARNKSIAHEDISDYHDYPLNVLKHQESGEFLIRFSPSRTFRYISDNFKFQYTMCQFWRDYFLEKALEVSKHIRTK